MMSFDDMLARANPGDEIIYHRGFHCLDLTGERRNAQAKQAWDAHVRGDVLLYQRRIKRFHLEYCAKVLR
jgi:hypothetical protein